MTHRASLYLAALLLGSAAVASAATVQFDINSGASPTQAGWTAAPGGNGTDGTVTLATSTIGPIGTGTRDRGAINTDGPGGDVANNDMWRDFIFANEGNGNGGNGLLLSITGLAPNTIYPVTIWGYDQSSNGQAPRVADWSGGGGAGTLSFDPNTTNDPTSLNDHSFVSFNATSDGTGALALSGVARASADGGSTSHDVFVNGLEIGDPIPEPSAAILGLLGALLLARRRR